MPINNMKIYAQQICEAIKNKKYNKLKWEYINIHYIDTTYLVNDTDINFCGQISPLHYAALKGEFDIVEKLINRGARPEKEVYGLKYKKNIEENFKKDKTIYLLSDFADQYKCSLIAFLYKFNKAQLVNLLNHFFGENSNQTHKIKDIRTKITASANKSYDDLRPGGINLLMKALNDNEKDLVQALFKAGANGNITNKESQNELNKAINSGNYENAKSLVNKAYKKKRMSGIYWASTVVFVTFIYSMIALPTVDPNNADPWIISIVMCLIISIFAMVALTTLWGDILACNRLEESKITPTPSTPPLTPRQQQKVVRTANTSDTKDHTEQQKGRASLPKT